MCGRLLEAVDALPSLRLRKRERYQVLRECGTPMKRNCASCGFDNAPGIKFCGECGKPLSDAAKTSRQAEPRSYSEAADTRDQRESQRRTVMSENDNLQTVQR